MKVLAPASQRIEPGSRVVAERFELGKPTILTTRFERDKLEKLYGGRVIGRAFDGALMIRLGASAACSAKLTAGPA